MNKYQFNLDYSTQISFHLKMMYIYTFDLYGRHVHVEISPLHFDPSFPSRFSFVLVLVLGLFE